MTDRGVEERLDRIARLLQLAFRESLSAARDETRRDAVNEALLDETAEGWVPAGELKRRVMAVTKQSEATVKRRIAALIALGALDSEGTGSSIKYRSSGIL